MKIISEYNGFQANQLILDGNNHLARIVYIEIDDALSEKFNRDIVYVRLGLINDKGSEFANCTDDIRHIKPYIPTKTLNPSEEKGFVINKIIEAINFIQCKETSATHYYKGKAIKLLRDLQANGETPEEANPVGQVQQIQLEDEIISYLTNNNVNCKIIHNVADIIKGNFNRMRLNKPLTTTKEQPKYLIMQSNYPFAFSVTKNLRDIKNIFGLSKEEMDNIEIIEIKEGEIED